MEPKHPPTVEAYLRETDRYKAFLVGYRPETPRPDKTRRLAGRIEGWERKWASSTHSTGKTCGTLFDLLNKDILLSLPTLTPWQQRQNFERCVSTTASRSFLVWAQMADVRFKPCLYTAVGYLACPIQRIQISEHTDPLLHRFIE